MMTTAATLQKIIDATNAKRSGKGWMGHCPAHEDGTRSLSIAEGDDSKILTKCMAGCDTGDVVAALGMKMSDLFPGDPPRKKARAQIVATYPYYNDDGSLLFEVVRLSNKEFPARRPDGRGGWAWNLDSIDKRPLYRHLDLQDIGEDSFIFVPEGEKDVDRMRAEGAIATTTSGGASKSKAKPKWPLTIREPLHGHHVVLLPDNDAAGRAHAHGLAGDLQGKAASVRVLDLAQHWPLMPKKGDVSDWLDAGNDMEELVRLAEGAPLWTPDQAKEVPPDTDDAGGDSEEDQDVITNYKTGEGDKPAPVSMVKIIQSINARMNNWPRRIDNMLFVDDPENGLDYFDRRTTAGLFGWLRRHNRVEWMKGGDKVSQAELFAEIERTAQRYDAIETLPHEPPIDGVYYRGKSPATGDGSHLRQLLDRFRPETTIDRHLIQASMMTAFWGGLPGCRPAFVVTSDDGRGVGKSKVAEVVGYLCDGFIDVSAGENIEELKTRMLTPAARTKRIALMDNVKTMRLSWAELEAMITSPVVSGRQLYVGEGQRPNLLTWFITLNGVSMATDMAQRSVIIKVVKGKNDGPWWEQTRQFIDRHREQIIGDIIAALRAEPKPLSDFTRWATWEQHVLRRLPDPREAQRLIVERQGEANCEQDEAEIIEEHFAEQLRRLDYDPDTAQVRIPVAVAARWFGWAVGEQTKTAAASKRLHQMATEGQTKRIAPDPSRTYGRCFIWTGAAADVVYSPIVNDMEHRLAEKAENRRAT